jgi:hypothetical protein
LTIMSLREACLNQIDEEETAIEDDHELEIIDVQAKAREILSDVLFGQSGGDENNMRTTTLNSCMTNTRFSPVNLSQFRENAATGHVQAASYLSEYEAAILRARDPVKINELSEEITLPDGQRGFWTNKEESMRWQGGPVPIDDYPLNIDEHPTVITKKAATNVEYVQEIAVRYLKPPTPPLPGEIIINEFTSEFTPPAPPIIIRQQPPRPVTPEPLVIREHPAPPPPVVPRKIITISGKLMPPPPRKVIIERLAPLPTKPQSLLVERWLPYAPLKRRVIYNRANQRETVVAKPKNVIIQWESPDVQVKFYFQFRINELFNDRLFVIVFISISHLINNSDT